MPRTYLVSVDPETSHILIDYPSDATELGYLQQIADHFGQTLPQMVEDCLRFGMAEARSIYTREKRPTPPTARSSEPPAERYEVKLYRQGKFRIYEVWDNVEQRALGTPSQSYNRKVVENAVLRLNEQAAIAAHPPLTLAELEGKTP